MPVSQQAQSMAPKTPQSAGESRTQPPRRPHRLMIGLYLGAFLGMLSETSMNIALPDLSDTFGITTGTAQWVVVGYMLAIGVVLPCVGFLLKWVKAKTLVLAALAFFLVGAVLSASAPTFALMLTGRILQGVGTGIVLPTMYASIMRVFPLHKIGAANGVAGLVIMFAPVIGPTLAGLLIGWSSWRAIFVLFAAVAIVAIAFTVAFFVTPIEVSRPKVDLISIGASVIGFGALVAGVSLVADLGFSASVIALLVVGIVTLAFYARRQLRIDNPVLDLKVLGIAEFRTPAIMVTCSFACTLAIMYLAPQQLQRGLGLDTSTAGMLMLAGGVVNAVCSFVTGRLHDRHGATHLVRIGAVVSIIGSLLFLAIGVTTSPMFFVFAHIVFMIGIPLLQQSAQSSALKSLPHALAADGSTVLNTMQQVVGAIGTAVATSLLYLGQSNYAAGGGTDAAQGFVNGSRYGYLFGLALIVVALVFSFFLKENRPSRKVAAA
ncbi:MFS transporter, DHA2 family, lincomycin resistance protein [Tessaracoccus bendigoensis DSM 12906]|uniref:MFS transporter, DHA2 family, lincomycin resistance protein n=1 Tax=Tessaracoccus bendigoensis DSM 12906 TaxID=1123357 RepID=A0A1M6JZR9_9ACTN|nr:MFS transporter [Tessaracoccus bendigoensis]SHJ52180.1 MFS transporter, DHA2 family, lincomycin resistance protein [Tessaracoccus bendigoensis DSM 12906]